MKKWLSELKTEGWVISHGKSWAKSILWKRAVWKGVGWVCLVQGAETQTSAWCGVRKGEGGWRGGQGHLAFPRPWEEVWVHSRCSGKLLERYRAVEWHELIKRRERKNESNHGCCVKNWMKGVKRGSREHSVVLVREGYVRRMIWRFSQVIVGPRYLDLILQLWGSFAYVWIWVSMCVYNYEFMCEAVCESQCVWVWGACVHLWVDINVCVWVWVFVAFEQAIGTFLQGCPMWHRFTD